MSKDTLKERLNYCEFDKRITNWIPRLIHLDGKICSAYQCETCDSIASEHYLNEMQKKYEKRTAGDERYLE